MGRLWWANVWWAFSAVVFSLLGLKPDLIFLRLLRRFGSAGTLTSACWEAGDHCFTGGKGFLFVLILYCDLMPWCLVQLMFMHLLTTCLLLCSERSVPVFLLFCTVCVQTCIYVIVVSFVILCWPKFFLVDFSGKLWGFHAVDLHFSQLEFELNIMFLFFFVAELVVLHHISLFLLCRCCFAVSLTLWCQYICDLTVFLWCSLYCEVNKAFFLHIVRNTHSICRSEIDKYLSSITWQLAFMLFYAVAFIPPLILHPCLNLSKACTHHCSALLLLFCKLHNSTCRLHLDSPLTIKVYSLWCRTC